MGRYKRASGWEVKERNEETFSKMDPIVRCKFCGKAAEGERTGEVVNGVPMLRVICTNAGCEKVRECGHRAYSYMVLQGSPELSMKMGADLDVDV